MTTTMARRPRGNGWALWRATLIGTVLQVAMVVAGHYMPALKSFFAPGGMAISLFAGWLYARLRTGGGRLPAALGGVGAGAICACIGILESYRLGDVPASLLLLGTASSAVTGAVGGLLGSRRS